MKIRLINGNLGKVDTIQTNAETWGELQANETVQSFMKGDTQGVIRENQCILDLDQADLPQSKLTSEDKDYDYTIFFVTKKSKAGSGTDRYDDMSYNQLRSECASRDNIEGDRGNYGDSVEMRQRLREDDESSSGATSGGVIEFMQQINDKLDAILDAVESGAASTREEHSGPTEDEQREFREIQSQL